MPREWLEFAIGRLPYASELFGSYRPMIGWASKRKTDRITRDLGASLSPLMKEILAKYATEIINGTKTAAQGVAAMDAELKERGVI